MKKKLLKKIIIFTIFIIGTSSLVSCNNIKNLYIDELDVAEQIEDEEYNITKNNVYSGAIQKLFKAIKNETNLSDELYVNENLIFKFKHNGEIFYINGVIYGKDNSGLLKCFKIEYDENKSSEMNLLEEDLLDITYDENKQLQPFLDILQYSTLYILKEQEPGKDTEMIYTGKTEIIKGNGDTVLFVNKTGYLPEHTFDRSGVANNYTISFHKENLNNLSGLNTTHISLIEEIVD